MGLSELTCLKVSLFSKCYVAHRRDLTFPSGKRLSELP